MFVNSFRSPGKYPQAAPGKRLPGDDEPANDFVTASTTESRGLLF